MEELLHILRKYKPALSLLLNKINNEQSLENRQSPQSEHSEHSEQNKRKRSYSDQDNLLLYRKQKNQQIYDLQIEIDNLKLELEKKEQLISDLKKF
jgi:hypothetical protein